MAGEKGQRAVSARFVMLVIVTIVLGGMIGLAVYTFIYAKGYSYLSDDPTSCVNCHVMEEQYNGWMAGAHANVATCNDCHLPHDNVVHKYYVKAENGFFHALKFTTGWHPENIEARDISLKITNEACLYCHADLTDDIRHPGTSADGEVFDCVRCHSGVGHE